MNMKDSAYLIGIYCFLPATPFEVQALHSNCILVSVTCSPP